MPKNTKKQKDKSSDFKKAKLKLGKGKKPATNAVDTSFKAHSIALPSQSIVVDKSQAGPSTKRRHTLPELVSLLRHYSAGTRKDALAGLRELFSNHEDLMESSISTVATASCKLISDEDSSVRKTVIEFQDWYLHRVQKTSILPHAPTLMLLATSAQSHIFPEIRIDAIKLMDIFLDIFPEVMTSNGTSGHAMRVLQGYLGLLIGSSSNKESNIISSSATVLSPQSKLIVIASLSRFLGETAKQIQGDFDSLWYLKNSFQRTRAYESFCTTNSVNESSLSPKRLDQKAESGGGGALFDRGYNVLFYESWQEKDIQDALGSSLPASLSSRVAEATQTAILTEKLLHQLLIEVCLDYAPTAFINLDGHKSILELKIVHAILQLASVIYAPILQNPSQTVNIESSDTLIHLEDFISHLSVYLPIDEQQYSLAIEVEDLIQRLNFMFSELYATIILHKEVNGIEMAKNPSKPSSRSHSRNDPLFRVGNWTKETIYMKVTANHPLGKQLSVDLSKSLLPIVWTLISHFQPSPKTEGDHSLQLEVLQASVKQIQSPGTSHGVKLVFIRFMTMLVLLQKEPEYIGSFRIQSHTPSGALLLNPSINAQSKSQLFQDWILDLPKLLWEAGTSNPIFTLNLLYCLLCCIRSTLKWNPTVFPNLCQRFVPFFLVEHASRGQLFGPYRKFSDIEDGILVQKMALDFAFSLYKHKNQHISRNRTINGAKLPEDVLLDAVDSTILGTAQESYWQTLRSLQ